MDNGVRWAKVEYCSVEHVSCGLQVAIESDKFCLSEALSFRRIDAFYVWILDKQVSETELYQCL